MKRDYLEPEIEIIAFVTEQTLTMSSYDDRVDEDGNIVTPGYGI